MDTAADAPSPPGEALDFIALAQLGRNDWRSILKFICRIALYPIVGLTAVFIAVFSIYAGLRVSGNSAAARFIDAQIHGLAQPGPVQELLLIFLLYVFILWGLRDGVVKSQRRPFLSLISADLRLEVQRVLVAVGIWLAATLALVVGFSAIMAWTTDQTDASEDVFWNWQMAPAFPLALCVIPIQAATEELMFRGWLTQTLAHLIRIRAVGVILVAILFSSAHGFDRGFGGFLYYSLMSLVFSAVSLRDSRLESAIGAHIGQNLFVYFFSPLTVQTHAPTLIGTTHLPFTWISLPFCAVQGAVLYGWIAHRARRAARRLQ